MRRSSCIVLFVAVGLLTLSALFYLHSFSTTAPDMTIEQAKLFLARGKYAMEHSDLDGVMDLFSASSKPFDRSTQDFRTVLDEAMRSSRGKLRVGIHDVTSSQEGSSSVITCLMDLGETSEKMQATYYSNVRLHLKLQKERSDHWWGLYSTEDWKITEAESDQSLDVPRPNL